MTRSEHNALNNPHLLCFSYKNIHKLPAESLQFYGFKSVRAMYRWGGASYISEYGCGGGWFSEV